MQNGTSWLFRIVGSFGLVDVTVPVEAADVGQWVHLVGGWVAGNLSMWLYKNGVAGGVVAVPAGTINAGAGVVLLGHLGSSIYPFAGTIDEVAIYGVLSDDRIKTHYAYGRTVANPTVAQDLRITLGIDSPVLLFNGAITQVDLTYEGAAHTPIYHCSATDDTARASRRRPFGQWTNVSATVVARALISSFVPGFGAAFVQVNLPPVTVFFDGSEGMNRCLTQITNLIGGYWYFEDKQLHLFQTETSDPPSPIDTAHPFLADPRVASSIEMSQVRTRVYGRGHGEALLTDVTPSDPLLPIADAVMFGTAGGKAIAGPQQLTYSGHGPEKRARARGQRIARGPWRRASGRADLHADDGQRPGRWRLRIRLYLRDGDWRIPGRPDGDPRGRADGSPGDGTDRQRPAGRQRPEPWHASIRDHVRDGERRDDEQPGGARQHQ